MADFETQVRESQSQVAEAQSKIAELTSRIETAREKMKSGTDISLDIENASLDDVHAHTELMNANIAELIMGLDDVTTAFSKDFDEIRSKTGWESFVGVFAKAKAESMRQERIRTASIDDKLQDLISKSDVIVQLLEGQLNVLEEQKTKVEGNLTETLDEREITVQELSSLQEEIKAMDPKIIALENKIASETDAAARTALSTFGLPLSRMAVMSAEAFSSVSASSSSGRLSCNRVAPARTSAMPSLLRMVRSVSPVFMLPLKPTMPTAPPYQARGLFSCCSMNRIAHSFGAPVTVTAHA